MAEPSANLARWTLELARRAATEQGRLARNYGIAFAGSFGTRASSASLAANMVRFGLSEFETLSRGSVVAGLLYCDALITSLQRSNDRFEKAVLKVNSRAIADSSTSSGAIKSE
jgi:hypothetical protein